ncbi:hypothetical protein SMALB_0286 [Streptomyces malaysiensis]|uniref:Uncharacterized protein n=1 Tax=Streptomyces malaysiensis TaxID=92644 RepID=A0A7X6AV12_STRMQ|nr:hypothetical protein [Streptomyces malaysiensis]
MRDGHQEDLCALAANIRADAEDQYASVEPGWQAGVEWTLPKAGGLVQRLQSRHREPRLPLTGG